MKVDLDPVISDPPSRWPWRRPGTDRHRPTVERIDLRSWWSGFAGDQDVRATIGLLALVVVAIGVMLLLPAAVDAAFDAPRKAALLIGTAALLLVGAAVRRRDHERWPD